MKDINNFINESKKLKRDSEYVKNIKNWIDNVNKTGNKLDDSQLNDLTVQLRKYFIQLDYSELGLGFQDKDLICDIAGYIIEAAAYDAIKQSNKVTSRSGRGLKIDGQSIYWDFAIEGIDEKFEIKSICKNGYHTGSISPSKNQKNDKELIYIIIPYKAYETGFDVITDDIKITRKYN